MVVREQLGIIAAGGLLYVTTDWNIIKAISRAGIFLFDVSGLQPKPLKSGAENEQAYLFHELEGIVPEGFNSVLVCLEVEHDDDWSPTMLRHLMRGEPVGYDIGRAHAGDFQFLMILLKVIMNTKSCRMVLGLLTARDREGR